MREAIKRKNVYKGHYRLILLVGVKVGLKLIIILGNLDNRYLQKDGGAVLILIRIVSRRICLSAL